MRVLCVKWGSKYPADYLYRLRSMCARNLSSHEFVCVTDVPVPDIYCMPLVCDLPTWWQKIGLFQPGLFPGENLYLDLDVVLTAPVVLPPLGEKLWSLDDFSYPISKPRLVHDERTRKLLGGPGTINSSVMYWRDDVASDVWTKFTPDVMEELHGDQNWITRILWPRIDLLPKGFGCSYKYHVMRGEKPAPIVVFHGDPKPAQLREQWITENWR